MAEESRVRIGVLTRTFGLAGALRCTLAFEAEPTIATPCDALVGYSESFVSPYRLVRCDVRPGELFCWFEGITSSEQAAPLVDRAVFLPADAVSFREPLSDPGLIGLEIRDETGEKLGTIAEIFRTPAHYIWSVEHEGREWMVPATAEFVLDVRLDERRATVRLIPGLFNEEPGNEQQSGS